MKVSLILFIIAFSMVSMFARIDLLQPTEQSLQDKSKIHIVRSRIQELPPAPSYQFAVYPIDLGGTVYDYMPGSYCSLPIRVQPEQTNTGFSAGGIYIVFQNRISYQDNKRVNYSYINPSGNISSFGTIISANNWESFPDLFIDPVTADPIAVFNSDADGNGVIDNSLSYDQYNLAGIPGSWLVPAFAVINNTELQSIGEFYWPYVYIGDSPISGKRRVYVTAESDPNSSIRVLLAFADFDQNDLEASSPATWNWQYKRIQEFEENSSWARVFKTVAVHNNYVVYVGEIIYNTNPSTTKKLFALVNDNYGEGDFTYYDFDYQYDWSIGDVQKADGSWLYGDQQPAQLRWSIFASTHFNAMFTSENTVSFPGVLLIEYFDPSLASWFYRPEYGHAYVKEFKFNVQTGEFGVEDVYPPDLSETPNNTPVVPWDLNGDGQVDSYDQDGYPEWIPSLPVFHTNMDNTFHYNSIKLTMSEDDSYEAMVWNDCYEAWAQANGVEGYDDWAETSKVMIATKVDGKWRTPITIDANTNDVNYNAAIDGMIPCYVYPGDKIQIESNDTARLHLFFLNDDSYGSSVMGEGAIPNPDNCRLEYAAIDFSTVSSNPNQVTNADMISSVNYPNPFNPTTTIKYNVLQEGNVSVEVYNLAGQKVTTLVNTNQKAGEHSIVWNGTDNTGKTVTSGIYLYKIKNGKYTSTKKMILMK